MVSENETTGTKPGDIYKLITQVMRAVGSIGKDRKNDAQNYRFRGIDDVYNAMHGPLADAGVFVVPQVLDVKRAERERLGRDGKPNGAMFYVTLTVRHTFYAPDGSFIDAITVGEAMDTGDKASNTAMSAAMKYALIEVFAIPTEGDNDTENDSPEVKPQVQRPAPAKSDDPLADESFFRKALSQSFGARSIGVEDQKAIVAKVLKAKKAKSIGEMKLADRQAFVEAILAGKFDPKPQPEKAVA